MISLPAGFQIASITLKQTPLFYNKQMLEKYQFYNSFKHLSFLSQQLKQCYFLRQLIQQHNFGYFYKRPVNPYLIGLPDYWKVIKKPIDLTTIKRKFLLKMYKKRDEFNKDMTLMFENSYVYNQNNNLLISQIKQIYGFYLKKYEQIDRQSYNNKKRQRSSLAYPNKLPQKRLKIIQQIFTDQKLIQLGRILQDLKYSKKIIIYNLIKQINPFAIQINHDNSQSVILEELTSEQIFKIIDKLNTFCKQDFSQTQRLLNVKRSIQKKKKSLDKKSSNQKNKSQKKQKLRKQSLQVQSSFEIDSNDD